jgi:hypothetical protein
LARGNVPLGSGGGGEENDIPDSLCRKALVLTTEELNVGWGMGAVVAGVERRSDVVAGGMMVRSGVLCSEAVADEWKAAAGLGGDTSEAGWKDSDMPTGSVRPRGKAGRGIVSPGSGRA